MNEQTPVSLQRPAMCREALAYFYVFNVVLLMVVGHAYLSDIPKGTSALGWAATLLAYTSNFALLAFVPLVLAMLTSLARRNWLTFTVAIILYASLVMFIYADSVIYQLWRFHFNGMVLNLLTTPGASDSVTAGKGTVAYTAAIVALVLAAEIG